MDWLQQKTLTLAVNFITFLMNSLNSERPNAIWCTDITYIWTQNGLCTLLCNGPFCAKNNCMDSFRNNGSFQCNRYIEKAKAIRNTDLPLIIHTDRGSQYVSQAWREATKNMQRNYSHKGYPYDNACIESFHSLIKREWLNRFNIKNYRHAYNLIFEYIETFYNTIRIHSHCDYMSPDEFEKLYERVKSLSAA